MPRAAASPDAPPAPRQLWHAAQRLAGGDGVAHAAAQAGMAASTLRARLDAADPDLLELIAACRAVQGLSPEAKAARVAALVHDAAERELAAGGATVLAAIARLSGCLARRAEDGHDEAAARYLRLLMTITPEELGPLQRGERFIDVATDPRFADDPLFAQARNGR
jgi:hypothetical protein